MEEDGYDGADSGTNHGRWTREEHAVFLHGLELHGKEWKKIADMISSRSVVQIRTHAQKYFQKVAKTTGGPVMSTSKKGDVVLRPPTRRRRLEHEHEDEDGDADSDEQGALGSGDDLAGGESEVSPGGGLDGDEWRGSSKDEPGEPESWGSSSSSSMLRGGGGPPGGPPGARKPGSIKVPVFRRPDETSALGLGKLKVPVARPPAPPVAAAADDGGGITPRTVAAATILLRPRIQHKLATGSDTPKTRETASWLESHEARAAAVLGKRRRTATPNAGAAAAAAAPPSAALSWETAASNR
jgi:SHAQKYF class myb-like DNA-binding protein